MHLRFALPVLAALAAPVLAEDEPVPFPAMAPTIGALIGRNYYDPSRFRPRLMVERALRALEGSEISIDTGWSGGVITVNLAGERIAVPAAEPASLDDAMALIEAVRDVVDRAELPAKRRRELDYTLMNGALRCLDPHTYVIAPEPAKDFGEDIKGEFYGIGAFLQQEEGVIRIDRVMAGLPAEKAGIEDGDLILGVDGEKTAGLSLDQAVRRIKGPKGTTVTLTLERKGRPAPLIIPVVRNLVQIIAVRHTRVGDIGYIRMDEFAANTANQLYDALLAQGAIQRRAAPEDPVKAVVLDLRFNGGGLLDQARLIGGFFLDRKQEIVRTVELGKQPDITFAPASRLVNVPVLVLISGATASAAEIVSGALQRNDRAVVVGTTSFGKGSVQNITELRDQGRLRLTTQEYQLPGGVSIQDVGVIPDLLLKRRFVRKDGTVDIHDVPREREGDDEFALKSAVAWKHDPEITLGWLSRFETDEQRKLHVMSARDFRPDQEASLAIDLIATTVTDPGFAEGWKAAASESHQRSWLLTKLKTSVAARAVAESNALADALAAGPRPLAWGAATGLDRTKLTLSYTGPTTIVAGETVALPFTVTNAGQVPAGRLYAVIDADEGSPFWQDEVAIGEAAPGTTATGVLLLRVPPRLHAGEERFILVLHAEGVAEELQRLEVALTITPQPRPRFNLTWSLEEPAGGDGRLDPGESAAIRLIVRNDGSGPSEKAILLVYKDNDPFVQLGANRIKIDQPIAPGASVEQLIPVTVAKEARRAGRAVPFANDRITLQVRVDEDFAEGVDGRYRASFFSMLRIPIGQPLRQRQLIEPTLALVGQDPGLAADGRQTMTLTVRLDDDNPRYVAAFQGDDKIDLQPIAALTPVGRPGEPGAHWLYRTTVTLKPGLNALRIVAADQDDILDGLPVRVWGPPAAVVTK